MMGQTSGLEKSAKCTAAIAVAFTICKFGADDDTVSVATASSEDLLGVMQHTTVTAGDEVRVMLEGISRVVLGGTVTRGGLVTSDAAGKAVAVGAVGGTNYNAIGRVLASGVANDIVPVLLANQRVQG